MKTIIAGSREGVTLEDVEKAVSACGWRLSSVVSGKAPGADRLGEVVAHKLSIPVHDFPANWKPLGPKGPTDYSAGHKRNALMAENAEALIAIWDGESDGTKSMIKIANKKGLHVYVYRIRKA